MSKVKKISIAALGAVCVAALGATAWLLASGGVAARAEEDTGDCASIPYASPEEEGYRAAEEGDREISPLSTPLEQSEELCETCGGALFVATIDPTCLAEGFTAYYCPYCDVWEKRDTVEAAGHSYEERTVDPTCTSYGYTVHACSECGASYRDSIIPNLGHDYQSSVLYPTCEYDGGIVYTCTRCGDSYMDEDTRIAATGHSFITQTYEPTCTEYGYLYEQCSSCGAVNLLETLEPLGHDFETERVAGEGDALGYTIYRCARCNFVEIGEIGAAHHFEATKTVEPTCDEEGYTIYVCKDSDCEESYRDDVVPALGHEYVLRNFAMNRSAFTAVVNCSRCGRDAGEDVTISVSYSGGTVSAKGESVDISALSGLADVSIFAGGTRIFYLSNIDIDGLEDSEYEASEDVCVSVTAEGLLTISYVVDGKERADTLTLYLVEDGRMVETYPSGGEANLAKYGFSDYVSIYAVTSSGALVYSGTVDASGFVCSEDDEDEDEDYWDDEDWDDDEDVDSDEEDEKTEGTVGGEEDEAQGSDENSGVLYAASDAEGNELTVVVDSEGVLTLSYISPEGEDLTDELFVYIACGEDFALVAAPSEIDLGDYDISGDVSVTVFGRDGAELVEFSVSVSQSASGDASSGSPVEDGSDGDVGDEDSDEGSGSSGAGVIVAAVIVILLIAALIVYFVWSHRKKKAGRDNGDGKKGKDENDDVFEDDEEDEERDTEEIEDIEDEEEDEYEEDEENKNDGDGEGADEEINEKKEDE